MVAIRLLIGDFWTWVLGQHWFLWDLIWSTLVQKHDSSNAYDSFECFVIGYLLV